MAVAALLNFEGADASTVFTDGTANQTWAIGAGSPTIQTAQFKDGASSFNTNTTGYITSTLATTLSGDFTVECWFRPDDTAWGIGDKAIFQLNQGGSAPVIVYMNDTGVISVHSVGVFNYDMNDGVVFNAWNHIAIQRKSDLWAFFVNGLRHDTSPTRADTYTDVRVGGDPTGNYPNYFHGWIDGFRVLDESMYLTSHYNQAEASLGLTYTPQTTVIEIGPGIPVYMSQSVGLLSKDPMVIVEGGTGGGVPAPVDPTQYWG